MRKLWAAILVLSVFPACAASRQASVGQSWEEEIRAAEQRHRQAFLAADTAALRDMFSEQLVVNSPLNSVIGKAQLLDMVKSGRLAISSFDQRIEAIRRFGDIAVVMGDDAVVYAPPSPLAGQTQRRRFTDMWQQDRGGWRFVARQATVIH